MLDRRAELAYLPLRDARAAPLLEALPEQERFASWRLARAGREPVGYGRGAVELLGVMTSTRLAARALDVLPGALLEGLYALVARSRSRLGPLVPDRPGPVRFP